MLIKIHLNNVIRKNIAFGKKDLPLALLRHLMRGDRREIIGLDPPPLTLENSFLNSSTSKIIEIIGIG